MLNRVNVFQPVKANNTTPLSNPALPQTMKTAASTDEFVRTVSFTSSEENKPSIKDALAELVKTYGFIPLKKAFTELTDKELLKDMEANPETYKKPSDEPGYIEPWGGFGYVG